MGAMFLRDCVLEFNAMSTVVMSEADHQAARAAGSLSTGRTP